MTSFLLPPLVCPKTGSSGTSPQQRPLWGKLIGHTKLARSRNWQLANGRVGVCPPYWHRSKRYRSPTHVPARAFSEMVWFVGSQEKSKCFGISGHLRAGPRSNGPNAKEEFRVNPKIRQALAARRRRILPRLERVNGGDAGPVISASSLRYEIADRASAGGSWLEHIELRGNASQTTPVGDSCRRFGEQWFLHMLGNRDCP